MIDFKKFKFIISFSSSGDLIFTAREEVINYETDTGYDKNFSVTYSNPIINNLKDLEIYFSDFIDEFKDYKLKKIETSESEVYTLF